MTRNKLNAIINAITSMRDVVDDNIALAAKGLYPEWKENVQYHTGERHLHNGVLYKCLQDHTSQSSWTPSDTPSLWARVLIPDPDVIPEWVQPDSTNPYMTGDKVTHNNKTWVSGVDNNVWEPGVYGWNEVTNE